MVDCTQYEADAPTYPVYNTPVLVLNQKAPSTTGEGAVSSIGANPLEPEEEDSTIVADRADHSPTEVGPVVDGKKPYCKRVFLSINRSPY